MTQELLTANELDIVQALWLKHRKKHPDDPGEPYALPARARDFFAGVDLGIAIMKIRAEQRGGRL